MIPNYIYQMSEHAVPLVPIRRVRMFSHVKLCFRIPNWNWWYQTEIDDTELRLMIPNWDWWYWTEIDGTQLMISGYLVNGWSCYIRGVLLSAVVEKTTKSEGSHDTELRLMIPNWDWWHWTEIDDTKLRLVILNWWWFWYWTEVDDTELRLIMILNCRVDCWCAWKSQVIERLRS